MRRRQSRCELPRPSSLEEAASSCAEGSAEGTTSAPMELQAHSTAVAVQPCAESTAVAVKRSVEVTADGVAQATQATIQSMRVVLQQVQAIGDVSLEAQVHRAIAVQERKQRLLAREHPVVTETMMSQQDADRWRTRKEHLSIRKAFEQEKQRRVTIKELVEEQEKMRLRRLALLKASTVVECENAVKSWEVGDLGQGHPTGGSPTHIKNRKAILERLRARAKPLPPDLSNDWQWFLKLWDAARVRHLRLDQRRAWGAMFLDLVKDLLKKLRDDEDAFTKWIRSERRLHLCAPALSL